VLPARDSPRSRWGVHGGSSKTAGSGAGGTPTMGKRGQSPSGSGGLGHQGMHPQAMQPTHVIGEGHQTPLKADFGFPTQEKLPEPHGGFDDAEDGLDGLLPLFV